MLALHDHYTSVTGLVNRLLSMGPVARAVAMPPHLSSSRRVSVLFLSRVRRKLCPVKATSPAIFSGVSPALSVTSSQPLCVSCHCLSLLGQPRPSPPPPSACHFLADQIMDAEQPVKPHTFLHSRAQRL